MNLYQLVIAERSFVVVSTASSNDRADSLHQLDTGQSATKATLFALMRGTREHAHDPAIPRVIIYDISQRLPKVHG
jgi:hypothetical protein